MTEALRSAAGREVETFGHDRCGVRRPAHNRYDDNSLVRTAPHSSKSRLTSGRLANQPHFCGPSVMPDRPVTTAGSSGPSTSSNLSQNSGLSRKIAQAMCGKNAASTGWGFLASVSDSRPAMGGQAASGGSTSIPPPPGSDFEESSRVSRIVAEEHSSSRFRQHTPPSLTSSSPSSQ